MGGVAIIYITHRLSEVKTIADRAVVLRDGAIAGALAREELTHDNIIRLMVGRDHRSRAPTRPARSCTDARLFLRSTGCAPGDIRSRPISFGVGRGEILGFAGLVGAGRSEVARAIFGIEAPSRRNDPP